MSDAGNYYYELQKKTLINSLELLEKYKVVNDFLTQNDWLFISPIFFQGIELDYFQNLKIKGGDQKKEITNLIFHKFFNLNWTASFIDGYCNRCNYIEPFLFSIEHSLVLAFQKDYEGGIKTLIPIVEGILRKYLAIERNMPPNDITFSVLRNSFLWLKDDLISKYKSGLYSYSDQNNIKVDFTDEQMNELISLETSYYDGWFSFITTFIDKSFYLNTKNQDITNQLNRHAILHEYGLTISYSLENYIKIYFVIQFLTWIFLRKERKSSLNQINTYRFFEKAIAYKNIIELSETLIYEKHLLYQNHKGYNQELLREKFNVTIEGFPTATVRKYKILRGIDRFLWRKRMK